MTAVSLAGRGGLSLGQLRGPVAVAIGLALIAAYYFLPGLYGLPALAGFVVFAALELPIAVALTLAAAPFYLPNESNPLPPKAFGAAQFTLVEALTIALFSGLVLRELYTWLRARRYPAVLEWARFRGDRYVVLAGLGLLAIGLLSVLLAKYQWVALREWRTVIVEPLLFFVAARTAASTEPGRRQLAAGFLAAALAVSAFVIGHYYLVGVVEEAEGVARALGIYHSPNALALFLDRVLPFALAVTLGWRSQRGWLAFGVLTIVLVTGALGLTYSRAAWIAAAIGVLFVFAVRNRRAGLAALGALVVLGAVVLATVPPERLLGAESAGRRLYIWQSALTLVGEHPLTGIGLDNFLYYYRDEGYLKAEAVFEPDISHPHNWLLDWWLRLGVLGLVAFAVLQFGFWRNARAIIASPIGLGVSGLMLVTLLHGLVDNHFFVVDLAFVFWFALALANGEALSGGARS